MANKVHIKKGDTVKVIAGNAKGSQGRVLSVDMEATRASVEGLNLVSVHTKPNAKSPDGGIIKREAGIHLSNLMVVDASGAASRVGRRKDKDGSSVRYSKKSGQEIK